MEWHTVQELPIVTGEEDNYWIRPQIIDDLLALEIPTGHDDDVIYMLGSIGEQGIILDGWGDDSGCTVFDVSRWAVFEPPKSK